MAIFKADLLAPSLLMQTGIDVIIPENDTPVNERDIVFLLHGLSDNHSNWLRRTSVERYADEYGCVVVIPEVQRSYYCDMKYGLKYFSYITEDLPKLMNKFFNTTLDPKKTFVAGLSMGGYGALKCGLAFPERYAGVAAFSSACDFQLNINEMRIGSLIKEEFISIVGEELMAGEKNDLFFMAEKAAKSKVKPRFFMTCGTEDTLLPQNHNMRDYLKKLNFDVTYDEWEDDHTWRFWDASIQLAFDFFFADDDE